MKDLFQLKKLQSFATSAAFKKRIAEVKRVRCVCMCILIPVFWYVHYTYMYAPLSHVYACGCVLWVCRRTRKSLPST